MIEEWELLEALMMAQSQPVEHSVSEEALARFALGWSDDTEEEEVLASLVRSESLRNWFIEVRSSIEKKAKQPISELKDSPLDHLFRLLVQEAFVAFQASQQPLRGVAGRTVLRFRPLSHRSSAPSGDGSFREALPVFTEPWRSLGNAVDRGARR